MQRVLVVHGTNFYDTFQTTLDIQSYRLPSTVDPRSSTPTTMTHMPATLFLSLFLFLATTPSRGVIRRGTVAWRGNCTLNWDCEHNLTCVPVVNGSSNCLDPTASGNPRCQCRLPSTHGGICNDLADCAKGLRCIKGLCVVPGAKGTLCGPSLDDGDCDSTSTCINGLCRSPAKENGTCEVFWNCDDGLACIGKTCRPKSKQGEPCDSSIDCETYICAKDANGVNKCDSDVASIMGSLVAFCVVILTTGTLQFCAWRPRRRQ